MGTTCLLGPGDRPFAPSPASWLFWVLGFTTWGSRVSVRYLHSGLVFCETLSLSWSAFDLGHLGAAALTALGCVLSGGVGCCPSSPTLA